MTNRFFLGQLPVSGDFAVRFSSPGFDALSESNLSNFLIHEDVQSEPPLLSGVSEILPNSDIIIDTGINNTTAPPDIFFFAQKRFSPIEFFFPGQDLYCSNVLANDYRNIRFFSEYSFSLTLTYAVYRRRIGQ